MKVIAYYRVSTEMQIESGAGLSAQEDICKQWAQKNGFEIHHSFVEKAISGAAPLDKRPALFNAICSLEPDSVLLVSRLDRLSRNLYGALLIEEMIRDKKSRIVSAAGEGTDSADPGAKMMRDMFRVVAAFERDITRVRIKSALAAKKARGERAGSLRFGFMVGPDKKLVINPACIPHLEKMKELRSKGVFMADIAQEMNKLGLLNRKNKLWTHDSVWRALRAHGIKTAHPIKRSWS